MPEMNVAYSVAGTVVSASRLGNSLLRYEELIGGNDNEYDYKKHRDDSKPPTVH